MRYTGIQPHYFPKLHYFNRVFHTDIFLIRDEVQFVKKHKFPDGKTGKSHQADTPIKQATGEMDLTIPIAHNGLQAIKEVKIAYINQWQVAHKKTIKYAYSSAPLFEKMYPSLAEVISHPYVYLSELTIASLCWAMLVMLGKCIEHYQDATIKNVNKALKETKLVRLKELKLASQLQVNTEGMTPSEKIVAYVKTVGANEDYCGGTAMSAYMNMDIFEKAGIKVTVQDWKAPEYQQRFPKLGFIPNLSIIDLLMNIGPKEALKVLNS